MTVLLTPGPLPDWLRRTGPFAWTFRVVSPAAPSIGNNFQWKIGRDPVA